ncbi:hypothetical protein RQP46_008530 [Phenoliferia psychrophenolica]
MEDDRPTAGRTDEDEAAEDAPADWSKLAYTSRKRIELMPEEALYLAERGTIELWSETVGDDGELLRVPMSIQQAWAAIIGHDELTLERFNVYAQLKRLGYVLVRSRSTTPLARPLKATTVIPRSTLELLQLPFTSLHRAFLRLFRSLLALPRSLFINPITLGVTRVLAKGEGRLRSLVGTGRWTSYDQIFSKLQIVPSGWDTPLPRGPLPKTPSVLAPLIPTTAPSCGLPSLEEFPYQTFFNVYKPITKFRKSAPPPPDFEIVVIKCVLLILPLALGLAAVGVAHPLSETTALSSPHNSLNHALSGKASEFVSVSNGTFYQNGKPTYIVSMNYWNALNLAASAEAGGNLSRFSTEMQQMADKGVNNLRIMASSEASQFGIQPFRMYPALMISPGVYNEEIFIGLDRTLAKMSTLGMTAVMTLNNFWHWSGGISQYVSWATNSTIPYPPSWDPTLNPPYGDYSTNGSWGSYLGNDTYSGFPGYAGRFYNDTSISNLTNTWWRSHIKTVINRRNTINGRIYKDDPTIMTWELMNEPQDPPLEWVTSTAEFIKSLAPKQLVTVQNWGYYDPLVANSSSLQSAIEFADGFLTNVSQWSVDIGKPVILEEFGMARDNWENVAKGAPNSSYLYDPSAGTTHKDTYFTFVLLTVLDLWKGGKAFAGTGWYDLYDGDYAMDIVKHQADEAKKHLNSTS